MLFSSFKLNQIAQEFFPFFCKHKSGDCDVDLVNAREYNAPVGKATANYNFRPKALSKSNFN